MNSGWRDYYARYKTYFMNVMGQYRNRGDLQVYIEILLSLATVSIFSIFALRPTLITIAGLVKEIETKKEVLAQLDDKVDKLSKAQIVYDQQIRNIALLDIAVPKKPSPSFFIRQIEWLSFSHQLPVTSLSIDSVPVLGDSAPPAREEKSQPTQENSRDYGFSLTINFDPQNYESSNKLLSDMENLRMPIRFNNIEYVTTTGKDGSTKTGLTINGKLFYSVPERL